MLASEAISLVGSRYPTPDANFDQRHRLECRKLVDKVRPIHEVVKGGAASPLRDTEEDAALLSLYLSSARNFSCWRLGLLHVLHAHGSRDAFRFLPHSEVARKLTTYFG